MKQITTFLTALGMTATAGANSGDAAQLLSPKEAAAAFYIGRVIEQEAPYNANLLGGFADHYRLFVLTKAATVGGTRQDLSATIVPCDLGGEVEIKGTSGLFYVLNVDFRGCQTNESGLVTKRTGPVDLTLLNVPSVPQRMVAFSFGRAGAKLLEERRIQSDDLFHVRLFLDYQAVGDFFERDSFGGPIEGDYALFLNGTFYEEIDATNGAGDPLTYSNTIDSNKVYVRGSVRIKPSEVEGQPSSLTVTTTKFGAGTLIYDVYEEGSTPPFTRKEWTFDNFKITTALDSVSGARLHSLDGKVHVNVPEAASQSCVSGPLRFYTAMPVAETGEETQQFTSGLLTINGTTIRLTDPGVAIKAPGAPPVEFADNTGFFYYGGCFY